MRTYTTVSGDTWDKVALETLGDEKEIVTLMEANKKHLHLLLFPSGINLTIPEVESNVYSLEELPPWKRVDA